MTRNPKGARNMEGRRARFPLVSIGLPAFNCEKTLSVAIRSILNQTYDNWELLLVEDGSSDRTLEVARSFPDPRILVFTNHVNKGYFVPQSRGLVKPWQILRTDGRR